MPPEALVIQLIEAQHQAGGHFGTQAFYASSDALCISPNVYVDKKSSGGARAVCSVSEVQCRNLVFELGRQSCTYHLPVHGKCVFGLFHDPFLSMER